MHERLDRVLARAEALGADGAILTAGPLVRWSCGFTGSNGLLIAGPLGRHLVTDGRYRNQAAREVDGVEVHIAPGALVETIREGGLLDGLARVVLPSERVTVDLFTRLEEAHPEVELLPRSGFLKEDLARKAPDEVERIRRAQAITDDVFEAILEQIRPGVRERELAAELIYRLRRAGSEGLPFEPIVASGPNAALPHARPGERRLGTGELVLLDFGSIVEGYASDMTRTVALGDPGAEAREVYRVVREAQQAALDRIRAGVEVRALDEAARDRIEAAGFGDCFTHSLGHGVGLEIHEWPRLSRQSDDTLPEDVVVSVEPGIYLPGRFGVRIEDLVFAGSDGVENLTRSTKELLIL